MPHEEQCLGYFRTLWCKRNIKGYLKYFQIAFLLA